MATIYEVISLYMKPYSGKILFLFILGIFAWVAYYAYNKWANKPKPYADIYKPSVANEATIYFFFADWCPHCKKAKPTWNSYVSKYDGKVINGSKLTCVSVNCTDTDNPETVQMVSQFDINSYPTIKLTAKNGTTYEFDAKISEKNLEEFVNMTV
jgi:thiol-disulfide isomerase/thioredoxin